MCFKSLNTFIDFQMLWYFENFFSIFSQKFIERILFSLILLSVDIFLELMGKKIRFLQCESLIFIVNFTVEVFTPKGRVGYSEFH